jgi:dTDP-4-amino-4,6-dideoxygalactose transaminase
MDARRDQPSFTGLEPSVIPLFYPPKQDVEEMLRELRDTLESRWWGQGPKAARFEQEFGAMFGHEYCAFVNSGTAALHLAYVLAGVGRGDEVIVPVLTCTATCHPILLLGATPVFADIRPDTLTVDPADVERKITPRTRAIVAVHLGGLVEDVEPLRRLSERHGIPIIEDAAQALGARQVGYGTYTCYSFQAIKHLTTGDGGMLVVKTAEDYTRAKRLRWFDIDREAKANRNWQAWDRRGITFDQEHPGYKYHGNDIAAAIGLAGLKTIRGALEHHHRLAAEYRRLLGDSKAVELLKDGDSADWLFMVKVTGSRDDLAEFLLNHQVETNVAHLRNDVFQVFGGKRLDLPGMNAVEFQYLCLPLNDWVSLDDVRTVCRLIQTYERKVGAAAAPPRRAAAV